MKKENIMLTLLISRPKQPGNDIDIYLKPLIDDLHEVWSIEVDVYDAFTKSAFNLKAILMWTISDFFSYGILLNVPLRDVLNVRIIPIQIG